VATVKQQNWNISVSKNSFLISVLFDLFMDATMHGMQGRGGGGGADAAHPGVVGDEEATAKEVAGDEEGEVAGVDDDAAVEELEELRRLRLSEADEDVEEGALVPFHGSGEADGDHGVAAAR
jgi:hypothetical protein